MINESQANAAWITQQWVIYNQTQIKIAIHLGYSSSALISGTIARFIKRWHPRGDDALRYVYNEARMIVAKEALENYLASDGIFTEPIRGIIKYNENYYKARTEHAFLLRCEGLTYRQISARLGVSGDRCRQMVFKQARAIKRAMSRTKFYYIQRGPNEQAIEQVTSQGTESNAG